LSPLNKDEIGRDITFGPSDAELQGFILFLPPVLRRYTFFPRHICWQAQQSVFIARLASQVKLMRALMVVVHETLGLFLKAPLAAGVNASLKSFFH
jgi:hypothetical protein